MIRYPILNITVWNSNNFNFRFVSQFLKNTFALNPQMYKLLTHLECTLNWLLAWDTVK